MHVLFLSNQGKGSFAFAWALDESAEERERGITMTVGVAFFTSRKYHIVLLDSPGHRDFVPNMISGATQADAAIMVIDASMGSFEAGIDAIGGQTREHAQLVRSFGVDQIIIVVNKMDVVEYSEERFDTVKQKLGTFLRSCGFKDSSISWIPASAMENQNLVAKPSDVRLSWLVARIGCFFFFFFFTSPFTLCHFTFILRRLSCVLLDLCYTDDSDPCHALISII